VEHPEPLEQAGGGYDLLEPRVNGKQGRIWKIRVTQVINAPDDHVPNLLRLRCAIQHQESALHRCFCAKVLKKLVARKWSVGDDRILLRRERARKGDEIGSVAARWPEASLH